MERHAVSGVGGRATDWSKALRNSTNAVTAWPPSAGVATVGLLTTAVAFHQISLLGERGLTPAQAAANFIPQTVAALTGTRSVAI